MNQRTSWTRALLTGLAPLITTDKGFCMSNGFSTVNSTMTRVSSHYDHVAVAGQDIARGTRA
ncbi:hypothetical protein [Streptomyces sp. NPDC088801]|uniref:hypothetical protein n=1 Tax=Streptomyces sp. NPDC088801 TaxID=3365903 RepID=UPI003811FAFA